MKWTVLLFVALCCGLASAKCKYQRNGKWGACSPEGLRSRTDVLKAEKPDQDRTATPPGSVCHPTRNITKTCRKDCHYGNRRRATWGECDKATNTVTGTRRLVNGDSCPAQVTEVFDCRILKRFGQATGRKAGRKGAGKKHQKKQQRRKAKKQQRRLQRKQKRQQRRQNRQQQN